MRDEIIKALRRRGIEERGAAAFNVLHLFPAHDERVSFVGAYDANEMHAVSIVPDDVWSIETAIDAALAEWGRRVPQHMKRARLGAV